MMNYFLNKVFGILQTKSLNQFVIIINFITCKCYYNSAFLISGYM